MSRALRVLVAVVLGLAARAGAEAPRTLRSTSSMKRSMLVWISSTSSRLKVRRGAFCAAAVVVKSLLWFENSVWPLPQPEPEINTGTCGRSRPRSVDVTTIAMAASVSRQQSKRHSGSTIHRDDR